MKKLLNCEFCKKDFYSLTRNYKQRFCSKSCAGKGNNSPSKWEESIVPWNKGLKNWRIGYRHSEKTKRKIGISNKKLNPKSRINELLRKSIAFKNWRREVFIRDNFTCQECGAKCQKEIRIELHPHHIKEFALYPQLRFDLSNGVTLCSICHKKKHKNLQYTGEKAVCLTTENTNAGQG